MSRPRADWDLGQTDPALVAFLRNKVAALNSPSGKADARPVVEQQTERPHAGEARAALVSLRNKLQVRSAQTRFEAVALQGASVLASRLLHAVGRGFAHAWAAARTPGCPAGAA